MAEHQQHQQQSVFETYLLPRPHQVTTKTPPTYLRFDHQESSVYATPPEIPNTRRRPKPCEKFQFSHIFNDEAMLGDVFNKTCSPLIERLIQGKDSLLFTMGVTGSGKTHTVFGEPGNPGIIPFSLRALFDAIEGNKATRVDFDCMPQDTFDKNGITLHARDLMQSSPANTDTAKTRAKTLYTFRDVPHNTFETRTAEKYAVCVSFYELYQDRIYDLLDDQQSLIQKRKHLPLKRDVSSGRRFVSGLRKIYADTAEEAFWVLSRGISARQSNETAMNTCSSRSHAIFTIELRTFFTQTQTVYTSQVNIVDLAGSERSRANTFHHGDRLAEAGSINRSLMVLGQCIEVLRNQQTHPRTGTTGTGVFGGGGVIPFRQNKLTELLFGNAILKKGGETKAVMIVNLSLLTQYEENVGVLRYASLAHEIEALPASELGGSSSVSRSASGEVRSEGPSQHSHCGERADMLEADWNERLAQMEFLLKEEECKRIDMEEKYELLQQEMIQQAMEMDEKMAEMERMYMYRLLEQNQQSYDHVDAKLEIMAASMGALTVMEDPVLEQKEQLIRDLEDEKLSLKQELESLRVGFRDGTSPPFSEVNGKEPKSPLAERKMKYNAPGSIRSVSKKLTPPPRFREFGLTVRKLRKVKSIFDLNADE